MLIIALIGSVILIAVGAGALGQIVWIAGLALFGVSLLVRMITAVSSGASG